MHIKNNTKITLILFLNIINVSCDSRGRYATKQNIYVVVKSDWQFPTNYIQTPSKSQLIYLHSALERQAGTLHPSTYVMILLIVFQYYFSFIFCIFILFWLNSSLAFKTNQIFIITWLLFLTLFETIENLKASVLL